MTTMLERVARAIYDCNWSRCKDTKSISWERADEFTREYYFAVARVALAAMEEPTQRMLDATLTDQSIHTWHAMLRAALNDEK